MRLSGEFKRFADEERFVLLAMHQTLVERGHCLRQPGRAKTISPAIHRWVIVGRP